MDTSNGNRKQLSPEDEEEERRSFVTIINTFKSYRNSVLQRVDKKEIYLNSLPESHQTLLQNYRLQLLRSRHCIDANHQIILKMIADVDNIFEEDPDRDADNNCYHRIHRNLKAGAETVYFNQKLDTDRVIITLKQIIRDWSAEGEEERRACYDPILGAITDYFKDVEDRAQIKVLVPGSGLGRLTYEIAHRGFYSEGNEFSYFMLIGANFILNKCLYDNQYTFYPYVHQTVNNLRASDPTREATFPDVSAIQNPPTGTMNMVAGDFLQVYTQANYWNCVATSFFIDCANNVLDFVEAIYNILKPGGLWVNLGPLLYHYSDSETENSIEPSYEDLMEIIKAVGFEVLTNKTDVLTKYTQNPRSMYQSTYASIFLICRKKNTQDAVDNVANSISGGNVQ